MDTFRFMPVVADPTSHLAHTPEPETIETPEFNPLTDEFRQFARTAEERKPYPVSHADVLHGVAVAEAAVRSAQQRRSIAVEEW